MPKNHDDVSSASRFHQPGSVLAALSDTDGYKEIANQSPLCIHEIGLDGRVLRMNRAGLRMLGLQFEHQITGVDYVSIGGGGRKYSQGEFFTATGNCGRGHFKLRNHYANR